MKHYITKAVTLAALLNGAQAWSYGGHVIIARIAQVILEKEDPTLLATATEIVSVLKEHFPTKTTTENLFPFVECAPFADAAKFNGGGFQGEWHFKDQPYLDKGGSLSDYTFVIPDTDVTGAIKGITAWMQGQSGYANDPYVKTITTQDYPYGHNALDSYSLGLRLLIHYVGDQHQPLHSETRVDPTYPDGDRGGNSFLTPSYMSCKNLHCVWDRVVYEWHKNPKLPFPDQAAFDTFSGQVDALMTKWPVS